MIILIHKILNGLNIVANNEFGFSGAKGMGSDMQGNSYIAGEYDNSLYYSSDTLTSIATGKKIYVIKYGSSGKVLWAKNLGFSSFINITDFEVDPSGNFYIGGNFNDTLTLGATQLISYPQTQVVLLLNAIYLVIYCGQSNFMVQ